MFHNRPFRWRRCFLAFGWEQSFRKGERKTIPAQGDS
jgi:hypothetical protein